MPGRLLHGPDLPKELHAIVDDGPTRVLPLVRAAHALHEAIHDGRGRRPREPSLTRLRGVDGDLRAVEAVAAQHAHEILAEVGLSTTSYADIMWHEAVHNA